VCIEQLQIDNDFKYLLTFLPHNWEQKAKELGALKRCRGIPNPETLLRLLLIHLAEGASLRETAVRARKGNLINVSDVTIMDRLRVSGPWFQWMSIELMKKWIAKQPLSVFGDKWNVKLIDGTRVKEPGPTGSSWCVHYSINLPSLQCDQLTVKDSHGNGETFKYFKVNKDDLFIGDRVYGVRPGILHIKKGGGEVLCRFIMDCLPLKTRDGEKFDLLQHLRTLKDQEIGDWDVCFYENREPINGRVCAIKKTRQATELAIKKVHRRAQKQGIKNIKPETIETAGYFFVFTTLSKNDMNKTNALEMYRGRWQIEIVFKRLKSVIELGHLRKTDYQSSLSWIHGKLFVAFLIEALITAGEAFFPWGYPISKDE
jgi:hypothetical protein